MTSKYTRPTPELARLEDKIAKLAEAYPSVTLDHPWGHHAYKVSGKTFLFLSADAEGLSLSVKLPHSRSAALALPYTEPTHYGLGKSGWVSARFGSAREASLSLIEQWLAESYRAIAPKKLAAQVAPANPAVQAVRAKKAAPPLERQGSRAADEPKLARGRTTRAKAARSPSAAKPSVKKQTPRPRSKAARGVKKKRA